MARIIISIWVLIGSVISNVYAGYMSTASLGTLPPFSKSASYSADTSLDAAKAFFSPSYSAVTKVSPAQSSKPYDIPKPLIIQKSGGGKRYDASNWLISRKYYELAGKSLNLASAPEEKTYSTSLISAELPIPVKPEKKEENVTTLISVPPPIVLEPVDEEPEITQQEVVEVPTQLSVQAQKQFPSKEPIKWAYVPPVQKKIDSLPIKREKASMQEEKTQEEEIYGIEGLPVSQYKFSAIDPNMFTDTIESVSNQIFQKQRWMILLLCGLFLFNLIVLLMFHHMFKRIYFFRQNNISDLNFNWVQSIRRIAHVFLIVFAGTFLFTNTSYAVEESIPSKLMYEGKLMNSGGNPVEGHMNFRFSFWRNVDYIEEDINPDGTINLASPNYLGWQEQHAVMLDSTGRFSMEIGSVTPFSADMFNNPQIYLQVEVKPVGQLLSNYELLDVDYGNDVIDRMVFPSVPYAFNADRLDFHDTGFEYNEIPYLDEEDLLPTSTIPGGTDVDSFTIDADGTSGEDDILSLIFGSTLGKMFSWNGLLDRFTLSDTLQVTGDLLVTGTISGDDQVNVEGDVVITGSIEGGEDNEVLLDDDVIITGDLYVVGELNGIDFGNRFQTELLSPIYPGAIFDGVGVGNMYDELDEFGGISRNAIRWETWLPDLQEYNITVRWVIPNDFIAFQDTPLSFEYRTEGTDLQSKVDISIEKGDELGVDQLAGTGLGLNSNDWAVSEFTFLPGTDWDGMDTILFTITTYSIDNFFSRVGDIRINFIRE